MRRGPVSFALALAACEAYQAPLAPTSTTLEPPATPLLEDPRSCVGAPIGGAPVSETNAWLERTLAELHACEATVSGHGNVRVALGIGSDGRVATVRALRSTLDECRAIDCLKRELTGKLAPRGLTDGGKLVSDVTLAPHSVPQRGDVTWGPEGRQLACVDPSDEKDEAEDRRLPPEQIQAAIRARYDDIRLCYESGLGRHRTLRGRVTVGFVIEPSGRVEHATVQDNEVPDCAVATCVRDRIKAIEFPRPRGKSVTVLYPIFFEPG